MWRTSLEFLFSTNGLAMPMAGRRSFTTKHREAGDTRQHSLTRATASTQLSGLSQTIPYEECTRPIAYTKE